MTVNTFPRPGAYIDEVLNPLAQTGNNIPGEAVAAFAATHNRGPAIPLFVSSWQGFVNVYGGFNTANTPASGTSLRYAVYSYFVNGGTGCYVLRCPNTDAVTALLALEDVGSATVFTASANSPGVWGNLIYIEVVPITSSGSAHVNLNIYYGGTTQGFLVETFLNVSTNPLDSRYVLSIVNSPVSGSNWITLSAESGLPYVGGTTDFAAISPTAMATGADGSSAQALSTYVPLMFDQYCQNQILNMNLPGDVTAADVNGVVTWAASREDVFVIADGPVPVVGETSAQVVTAYTAYVTGGGSLNRSSFVALYAPYLLIPDPASANPGATTLIPPSGSILGMLASNDALVGPQQAPAGTSYGQISTTDLEVRFSATDLNNLFPLGINAIKLVPGTGFCVYGARTLLQGYPSMYVSVRRTLMKIEHDCVELVQFALFEPNVPTLWSNITTVLTNYLTQQTQAGLLGSTSPANAFSIICDATNNSSTSAQAGLLNVQVAVALGSPAEIIIITLSQLNTGTVTVTSAPGTTT